MRVWQIYAVVGYGRVIGVRVTLVGFRVGLVRILFAVEECPAF